MASASVSPLPDAEQRVPHRGGLADPGSLVDPGAAGGRVDRLHSGQRRGQHSDRGADPDAADGADQQVGAGVDLGVARPAARSRTPPAPAVVVIASPVSMRSPAGRPPRGPAPRAPARRCPTSTTVMPTPDAPASAAGKPPADGEIDCASARFRRKVQPRCQAGRCRGRRRGPPVGAAGAERAVGGARCCRQQVDHRSPDAKGADGKRLPELRSPGRRVVVEGGNGRKVQRHVRSWWSTLLRFWPAADRTGTAPAVRPVDAV